LVLVAGGALVSVDEVVELSLQPVITPTVTPSSTIRVNNLFIVGVTFTKTTKRTSKIFKRLGDAKLQGY